MGDRNLKSLPVLKVICAHENMATLLFIIPAEMNFEQEEMTREGNEQEQGIWKEEWNEVGAGQSFE